jgi:hypothetical protein
MTQEQIIAVGRALLPYLRNDLTDVELGMAAHDAAAAVKASSVCPHCARAASEPAKHEAQRQSKDQI